MELNEIKKEVARLMAMEAEAHKMVYGQEKEVTQEEKDEYAALREHVGKRIDSLIPDSERLSICLTGVAEEGLSHYDIEDLLQTEFKPGEGVQYDSESGQFWMYVKPSLVQQVLRFIDYNFPRRINLYVEPNYGNKNPWFQNWTQAQRYLETVMGA